MLQWAAGAGGLPPEEVTFARILQERGYVTGLVGEGGAGRGWGLVMTSSPSSVGGVPGDDIIY